MADWYRTRSARDLGGALRAIRKVRSRTQTAFADDAALSRSTVQRMERGSDVAISAVLTAVNELGYELILVPQGSRIDIGSR
ncbi:MAG: helix-turn-helix domain-containing protein [Microbacteriaceae bacterium]|nr:helix-turn-helix domain-containing protein [Microbacteriaceae bacterium]